MSLNPCVSKASTESCVMGTVVWVFLRPACNMSQQLILIENFRSFHYRCVHFMDISTGISEVKVLEMGVLCLLLPCCRIGCNDCQSRYCLGFLPFSVLSFKQNLLLLSFKNQYFPVQI